MPQDLTRPPAGSSLVLTSPADAVNAAAEVAAALAYLNRVIEAAAAAGVDVQIRQSPRSTAISGVFYPVLYSEMGLPI